VLVQHEIEDQLAGPEARERAPPGGGPEAGLDLGGPEVEAQLAWSRVLALRAVEA
jgi:hypothetical protein